MQSLPLFHSKRLLISVLTEADVQLLVNYQNENRTHLAPWEPLRDEQYFSFCATKLRVQEQQQALLAGTAITFAGFDLQKSEIRCLCTFSNIVHGVFQACHLGYSVSGKQQGTGLMAEMLQPCIEYMFAQYELHRIMANYMPANTRSGNLLAKLGFAEEGLAKSYLKIAGQWQDHRLTAKLNDS